MILDGSGVNKVILLGVILETPRPINFAYQKDVLCFTLVTTEVISRTTGTYEIVERHQVQVPKEATELHSVPLRKGQTVYVEGKMRTRSYYNEQQQKMYVLEIIAVKAMILTGDQKNSSNRIAERRNT